jgi:hypothetical protein
MSRLTPCRVLKGEVRTQSSVFAFAAFVVFLIPLATAAPAGAAIHEVCSGFNATVTTKPPIPEIGSKNKVTPTVTIAGRLTRCTGPESGAGTLALTAKISAPVNCGSTQPKILKATETIKWTDGKTSTVSVRIPVFATNESFDGTVVSGILKGLDQAVTLAGSAPNGTCVTKPLSTVTLTLAKNAKFVFE